MDYTLKIITENNATRYLLCDSNQNYYSVNKLLHNILFEYAKTKNLKEICENVNKQRTKDFVTESFIERSIEKASRITSENKSVSFKTQKYIRHKATIIKDGQLHNAYRVLSLLFERKLFILLSVVSIFTSVYFFNKNGFTNINLLYNNLIASCSPVSLISFFLLSMLVVMFHEVGHASAAFKFKILPKEIGIGVYFIFPVLYTNVTNIWNLPATKRMVVNFGGIYFQLLINNLLILLFYLNLFSHVALLLLVFNTISILFSLNPFFRYDGYWLYSDLFCITNLKDKSQAFIINALRNPHRIKKFIKANNLSLSVIIYSITNAFFWSWIGICAILYLIRNIPESVYLIVIKEQFTIKSASTIFYCLLIILFICCNKKYFYNRIKSISHAKQ